MLKSGMILNDTYKIMEQIGSGGGGIIYRAFHIRMRKSVAIKLIKDSAKNDVFNRSEVDVLKNLKNDYLPQVIDFVEDGEDVYTVMEFVEGKNFKQIISEGKSFSEKQVRKYVLQLCEAVKYLHNHIPPIIHSDIKPSNVMLTPTDNICLIDFNISMISDNGKAVSKGGSKDFGAPEQFRRIINTPYDTGAFREEIRYIGDDETEILSDESEIYSSKSIKTINASKAYIDIRTDIYGIGATIYYLLTSRVPQGGRLDFRGIKCSSVIKDVILKAMNPEPAKRFRNVAELEATLKKQISVKRVVMPALGGAAFIALSVGITQSVILNSNEPAVTVDTPYIPDIPVTETANTTITEQKSENTQITFAELSEAENRQTSQELEMFPVPNLVGLSKDDAIAVIENAGFTYEISTAESNTVKQGDVISQNIPAEANVPVGSKIYFTVSNGKKIVVPSVINKDISEAKRILEKAGISYSIEYADDSRVDKNEVFKQSIKSGTEVDVSTRITIYVSTYEKPTVTQITEIAPVETMTNSITTINEDAPSQKKPRDLTSYFSNGTIRSRITKEYTNGQYEVTWYWENGLERFIEKYDSNDNLINLVVIDLSSRDVFFDEMPIITSEGYHYTRKTEGTYSYVRCYINKSKRDIIRQEYIDKSGYVGIDRTYKSGLTSYGYLYIVWYENNEQIAYREYNSDGSERGAIDNSPSKDTSSSKENITEVLVSNKTNSMYTGESIKLKYTVMPKSANQKVKITSSNPKVVSVSSDGTIKAMKVGTATIKVVSQADKTIYSEFDIVVKASDVKITKISMGNVLVDKGRTIKLLPVFFPVDTTQLDVEWSVDDSSIAKIDEEGNLTAISEGETMATVTSKSNSDIKCTFVIKVQ